MLEIKTEFCDEFSRSCRSDSESYLPWFTVGSYRKQSEQSAKTMYISVHYVIKSDKTPKIKITTNTLISRYVLDITGTVFLIGRSRNLSYCDSQSQKNNSMQ